MRRKKAMTNPFFSGKKGLTAGNNTTLRPARTTDSPDAAPSIARTVIFTKKNGFTLAFSEKRGYSKSIAQQWRDGRAAKATVCKTGSGGFNSHSRLQCAPSLRRQGFPLIVPCRLFLCLGGKEISRKNGGLNLISCAKRGIV